MASSNPIGLTTGCPQASDPRRGRHQTNRTAHNGSQPNRSSHAASLGYQFEGSYDLQPYSTVTGAGQTMVMDAAKS